MNQLIVVDAISVFTFSGFSIFGMGKTPLLKEVKDDLYLLK